jgi:hypothetical protein
MRSPDSPPCRHAPNSTLSIFWPDGSAGNAFARFSTLPPRPKLGAAVFGRRREPNKYARPILAPGSRPETPPRRFRAPAGAPQVRSPVSPPLPSRTKLGAADFVLRREPHKYAHRTLDPGRQTPKSQPASLRSDGHLARRGGRSFSGSSSWMFIGAAPSRELKRCSASAHVPCWYRRRRAAVPHRPLCWDE